ncbi:MAG: mechanosensitive ion channel [Gammaproteobacteria bacterium]
MVDATTTPSELNSVIAKLQADLGAIDNPLTWVQLSVLVAAAIVAWLFHRWLQSRLALDEETRGFKRITHRSLERIAFPLIMVSVVVVGQALFRGLDLPSAALDLAIPLLLSLAAIRVVIYLLRKGFPATARLKPWEHAIALSIWAIVALHLLGLLEPLQMAMDALGFTIGKARISLLAVVRLVLFLALLFVVALWIARVIENRVAKATAMTPAMKVGVVKFSKFFLIALAALITFEAAGIDLTTLTVFGGALGVGLGFGLQRIASNFISGFILIFDRSIKPGDIITIGNQFGWVQELRARYLVVRNRDGVETLIPNENLITSEVINWSYTDKNVRLKIPVQISYSDDPELAMSLMVEAARECPRILDQPEPVARLMGFGDNGISLEARVWIDDPQNGVANVLSEVNLGIWRRFKKAGITIPFPQRDVHLVKGTGEDPGD